MIKQKHVLIITALLIAGAISFTFFKDSGKKQEDMAGGSPIVATSPPVVKKTTKDTGKKTEEIGKKTDNETAPYARKGDNHTPTDVSDKMKMVIELRKKPSSDSVKQLASFLDDTESSVAQEALDSLGSIGLNSDLKQMVLDILINKITDDGYGYRGAALLTAASLDDGKQILPVIEKYASSDDEGVSTYAIRALSLLHSQDSVPVIAGMLGKLQSSDDIRTAFGTLAKINTPEAVAILEKNLHSEEQALQQDAVWALAISASGDHVEYLVKAVASDDLTPESMAVLATSQAGPAVFGSILQQEDMSPDKINQVLKIIEDNTIQAPGPVRSETATMIEPLFDNPNPEIQIAAIRALGKIGAPEDKSSLLIPKLQSDNIQIQREALSVYAQYSTPNTYKPLLDLFGHEDLKIRRSAFLFASPFLNKSDISAVEEALRENDPYMSEQAQVVLDKINKQ
jgi:HEAT repeat protein